MPKKKERMAGYIRFSDPSTPLDDNVMESQARAIREYGEHEGYIYDISKHEYREAISAYTVPYLERRTLLAVLEAAKKREFDVLVVTEVRSISRRTVEVFVIYDLLQKYGVRFETIQEKFEDSATGHLILSARAFSAEVERENTYARLQRGKKHRLQNGSINGHPRPAYGYVFIDTKIEVKAAYAVNTQIVYVDTAGTEWTEPYTINWMGDRCLAGWSCAKIARTLTDNGVPCPNHKKTIHAKPVSNVWHPSTVYAILTSEIYIGKVYANKYRKGENPRTKKINMYPRPKEEWVLLEGIAPPIFTREKFDAIQRQLEVNKLENWTRMSQDTPKEEIGLLRAGYAKCGICGRTMNVLRRGNTYGGREQAPQYACCLNFGGTDLKRNHHTIITLSVLDKNVRMKIRDIVLDPSKVREKVAQQRKAPQPVINAEDVQVTIGNIQQEINNLFSLARHATNDSTRERLGMELENLEKRLREAEAMLIDFDEDEEDKALLEAEIVRFEEWAERVRPNLSDPKYLDKASYEELRLAVRIIGLTAIIYPMHGGYPFRSRIESRPPEIMKKLANCNHIQQSIKK
jgi:DNA invertase Pin-like site-specific DNA recombinase